jgi:hypothetical protein
MILPGDNCEQKDNPYKEFAHYSLHSSWIKVDEILIEYDVVFAASQKLLELHLLPLLPVTIC